MNRMRTGIGAGRRLGERILASTVIFAALLLACSFAADAQDWQVLRRSVVELDIQRPGGEKITAAGFFLAGVPGLITSHRLIAGAESVTLKTVDGSTQALNEYAARDPRSDLIVLRANGAGLATGTYELLARAQGAFALAPPSDSQPQEVVSYWRVFQAAGLGDMISIRRQTANFGPAFNGAPLVDSLGLAVGMIEWLPESGIDAYCAVPIERVNDLMARADLGGPIASLATDKAAPWATPGQPARWETVGATLAGTGGKQGLQDGSAFLNRALQADPRMFEALLELGMTYQMQNQQTKAEEYYRRALELDPKSPAAHLYLGSCLFMQGMYLQSQFEYEAALDANPAWATPHVNLSGVFIQQGKPDRAEQSLRRALQLDPDLGIALSNLGVVLYSAGRQSESLEILRDLESKKSGYASQLRSQTINRKTAR